MQKDDTSQKALNSRCAPAKARPRSYLATEGPARVSIPSLLNSTIGLFLPCSPAAASSTLDLMCDVDLIGHFLCGSRNSLGLHKQRWHPPAQLHSITTYYVSLLHITQLLVITSDYSIYVLYLLLCTCPAEDDRLPLQPDRFWSCGGLILPNEDLLDQHEDMCQSLMLQTKTTGRMPLHPLWRSTRCQSFLIYRHPCKWNPRTRLWSFRLMTIQKCVCHQQHHTTLLFNTTCYNVLLHAKWEKLTVEWVMYCISPMRSITCYNDQCRRRSGVSQLKCLEDNARIRSVEQPLPICS